MRTAKSWADYRLIDTKDGERLERWGDVILIRPDPQVIWQTAPMTDLWDRADGHYFRSKSGGGQWEYRRKLPESWVIRWRELRFIVRPTGFKHTGLFPEQAVNWEWMTETIRNAGRPVRVLNLFAYTGGATLACAAAGAEVCHVDAAKGMVQWARENAAQSGLTEKPVRWIVDDCEKFIRREVRRGRKYDAIIMDPPSYGRGPNGEIWKLEDSIYGLVEACLDVLSDNPLFFLLNSYTTGLSPSVMGYLLHSLIVPKCGGQVSADEIGLPVELAKASLPCGATAVWRGAES
ncbi:MAG: class I SAM-dependent methyltransferase [Oscillospiraceae bacterium]|jgi:23S rRNA (cytosine1962-C5)-methyltransferase|nr:class I SAM-dependent methyltransferase [Oscillospiraceae bacterium]